MKSSIHYIDTKARVVWASVRIETFVKASGNYNND